jgi:tetratricopeptide (TPR) repeat protein
MSLSKKGGILIMCVPISVATQEIEGATLFNQGLLSYQKGNNSFTPEGMAALQEALAAFNKTIDNKPNTADFYYMRGVTSIQFIHFYNRPFTEEVENIFNEAIKDFESTLKYDESFFIAYAGIGNAYDRYGLFDKAIKWYDKTLEHKDDIEKRWGRNALANIYFSRGRAYHRTLKYCSIEDYEKAVEYNPHFSNTLMHLSTAYLQANRLHDAVAMADRSVQAIEAKEKKAPWDYRAYQTRAKCNAYFQNYKECVDNLNKALKMAPFTDPDILLQLGQTYQAMRNEEETKKYYTETVKACNELIKQPNQMKPVYTVHNTKGLAFMEFCQYPEAIKEFEKVVSLAPEYYPHAHTHYKTEGLKNLGLAYLKIGDKGKGGEYLHKAATMAKEQGLEFAATEIDEIYKFIN